MRAAIYLRVSTDHDEQKLSPEHQLMTCMEYAKEIGIETNERLVYNDAGFSGTEMANRAEVQRLIADARADKFEAIMFTAISRFARDTADALAMRKRIEQIYRIRMISVEEGYDSAIEGRNSEMVFTVYAVMAAHKSQEMSKAIRRGLRQSAASGRHIGNVTPYGYRKTADKKLEPDDSAAPIIRQIYDMYLAGMGSKKIAEELNRRSVPTARTARGQGRTMWQGSTVNAILHNPVYTGSLVANRWRQETDIALSRRLDIRVKRQMQRSKDEWIVVAANHEPLVDAERFELVQQMLRMKATNKGIRRTGNILTGMMFCAECGGSVIITGSRRNGLSYKYVRCAAVKRIGESACINHASLKYEVVLDAVFTPLRKYSPTQKTLDHVCERVLQSTEHRGPNDNLLELRKQVKRNKQQQMKAYYAYTENIVNINQFTEHLDILKSQELGLEQELADIEKRQKTKEQISSKRHEICEALQLFHHMEDFDPLTVRTAIAKVIDRIEMSADKRLKIVWNWNPTAFSCD